MGIGLQSCLVWILATRIIFLNNLRKIYVIRCSKAGSNDRLAPPNGSAPRLMFSLILQGKSRETFEIEFSPRAHSSVWMMNLVRLLPRVFSFLILRKRDRLWRNEISLVWFPRFSAARKAARFSSKHYYT